MPVLVLLLAIAASAPPPRAYGQETDSTAVEPAVADIVLRSDSLPSAADRARAMLDTLRMTSDSIDALGAIEQADPDADVTFIRVQALEQAGQMQRVLRSLAHFLGQVSPDSLPADSVRAFLRGYVIAHLDLIDQSFEGADQDFEQLRRQRSTATAREIGPLESEIRGVRAWADTLVRYQEWALGAADSLQLDVANRWESYDQLLLAFAENSVGRLQIAVSERDRLTDRIRVAERSSGPASEIADLKLRLTAAETRIEAIADNIAVPE